MALGADSKIEWTDHTFNPWVGCTKVSAACDHCYAESWAKRSGHPELWTGARRRTSRNNWNQPLKWDAYCRKNSIRQLVFCASLADVFDNQVPQEWRTDLFRLVNDTPHLDWLLLTKRPQNIRKMLPADWFGGYQNVWLGTTAENQQEYERRFFEHLYDIPATVTFVSYEPALGPLSVAGENYRPDWIICGGESGSQARMMNPQWARDLRDECASSGIAFFMKQLGSRSGIKGVTGHGSNPIEWPDDLCVREFPNVR